jgi:hypothetical protein
MENEEGGQDLDIKVLLVDEEGSIYPSPAIKMLVVLHSKIGMIAGFTGFTGLL